MLRAKELVTSQVADWHNNRPDGRGIPLPSRGSYLYPTAGLICHLAASDITQSNGTVIPPTITDRTGTNNGTRVGSPLYRTAATPAGGPAFESASSASITLPSTLWSSATSGHIFVYVKSVPTGAVTVNGPWHMGGEFYSFYPFSSGDIYEGGLSASNQARYTGTPSPGIRGVWRVYEVEHSGTTRIIRIDGTQQASETKTFGPTTSPKILGGNYGSDTNLQIAEFMAFNTTLSSGDAATVRSYLTAKNGATG